MKKLCLALVFGLFFAAPILADTKYEVDGGTVVVDSLGQAGETVTVKVRPDSGYVLYSLTVSDTSGTNVPTTQKNDSTYYFTMPNKPITINAVFKVAYSIDAEGEVDSTLTSIRSTIAFGSSAIYGNGSRLRISTNRAQLVRVYGVNGRLVKSQGIPAGDTFIEGLKSGFYMVKLSDGTKASIGIR